MVVQIRRLWNTDIDSFAFPILHSKPSAREQWGRVLILSINLLCPDTSNSDAVKSMPVVTLHH